MKWRDDFLSRNKFVTMSVSGTILYIHVFTPNDLRSFGYVSPKCTN